MVNPELHEQFLPFALRLTQLAEAEIMPRFRTCAVTEKPDGTEVTEADRLAETAIREAITAQYPGHGILGEEFGAHENTDSPYTWIIDPLDGTASFTLGLPSFGVLVALVVDNEPVVGVIHLPAMGETVYAAKGGGCWFRAKGQADQRVAVDPVHRVEECTASACGAHSSDIQCLPGQVPYRLSAIVSAARKFRFVGDCLQHALVCRGRLHVAIDTLMNPWDSAALIPCIQEAGGIVTDLSGNSEKLAFAGSLLSSSTPELHAQALSTLAPNQTKGSGYF